MFSDLVNIRWGLFPFVKEANMLSQENFVLMN